MICAICDKTYADAAPYMVSVCPDCRRHAAIGRAVEAFPPGTRMRHGKQGNWWIIVGLRDESHHGPTPLDALRKAGLCDE